MKKIDVGQTISILANIRVIVAIVFLGVPFGHLWRDGATTLLSTRFGGE